MLKRMFAGSKGPMLLEPWHVGPALVALGVALFEERCELVSRVMRAPALVYAAALALMLFCIEVFGVFDASIPFVYFQF